MNCCNPMTGKCEQGHGCPARETPHDKAARHFWEPNQSLHIEAYTGPSRLHRVLDWVGDFADAFKRGFLGAFRDAWAIVSQPQALIAGALIVLGFALSGGLVAIAVMKP